MIPQEILKIMPANLLTYANAAVLVAMLLGRAYKAIRQGGGLASIWRGLLYGENVPNAVAADYKSSPVTPEQPKQ